MNYKNLQDKVKEKFGNKVIISTQEFLDRITINDLIYPVGNCSCHCFGMYIESVETINSLNKETQCKSLIGSHKYNDHFVDDLFFTGKFIALDEDTQNKAFDFCKQIFENDEELQKIQEDNANEMDYFDSIFDDYDYD